MQARSGRLVAEGADLGYVGLLGHTSEISGIARAWLCACDSQGWVWPAQKYSKFISQASVGVWTAQILVS